jgi:outer membrane autotransporter protein
MAIRIMELEHVEALASTYDQLSPVTFLGTAQASLAANQHFSGAMLSCYQVGGAYRFAAETDCGWARLAASDLTQDPVRELPGFDEEVISIAGGTQKEIDGDLHVGGALSFETGRVNSEDLARSDVERLQAGAMIKQRRDALTMAAGLTGGFGRYDTTRFVDLPRPDVRATSRQHMQFIALRGRLAYTLESDNWYGRPLLDANYTYASFDGFTERGAGMANLTVESRSEGYFSVNPAMEFGWEVSADEEGYTRLYGRVGALHYVSGRPEITATLEGAPEGVAPFRTRGELDETYLDLALGVDLVRGKTFGMRVEYSAQLSDNTERQGVQLKLARRFT